MLRAPRRKEGGKLVKMRILLCDDIVEEVSGITVSYCNHVSTPQNRHVYIEVEKQFSPYTIYAAVKNGRDVDEIGALETELYFYDMEKWNFKMAMEDGKKRIQCACEKGYVDLSDLIHEMDYVLE